jgi:hypothetical protein
MTVNQAIVSETNAETKSRAILCETGIHMPAINLGTPASIIFHMETVTGHVVNPNTFALHSVYGTISANPVYQGGSGRTINPKVF